MFSLIGGMFYSLRQHRRRQLFANVIPAHIAVQIFGIGACFVSILKILILFSSTNTEQFKAEERKSEEIALWYLGEYLAENYAGKNLTVVIAPDKFADRNQAIRLKGLMAGLADRMVVEEVAVQFNKRRGRRVRRAYSFDKLDDLLINNLNTDVVLLLIGLPRKYYETEFWRAEELPEVFSYRGQSMEIDLDIKEGTIDGFITMNPRQRFIGSEENLAEQSSDFFRKYFIFARPDNIDSLVDRYPEIFLSSEDLNK